VEQTKPRLSRRTFLLAASVGTAATAAAIVGNKALAPDSAPDKSTKTTTGYQVTAHVRNYYRTAKI
jgi:hypothetical protein